MIHRPPHIAEKLKPYKVVEKPWGREIWLALNEHYCFKRLEINEGQQFSLQYHEKKRETILIHSGLCEVILDGDYFLARSGDVLDIVPGTEHRIKARSELLVLYEASTPEVDDVVRIEDDYGRENE